jgi:putative oxidoreductase
LVILGLFTPLGALALCSTMAVAAYQHVLTGGFNIYVLELVLLYLGGSLAILLNGPGRYSFDAGMAPILFTPTTPEPSTTATVLRAAPLPVERP